ncbi:hypothetical protein FRC01_005096 [Tulasnella sp. 417]|nr:hypothetical protein FRC01_005096 [Tulasnella sp. 417]
MHFISRVFVSCVLFLALVVRTADNDYNVIDIVTLVPFVPLILSTVASTCLVRHIILSHPSTGVFSHDLSPDHVNWATSSALATSTINWQENSPANTASSKLAPFAFLTITITIILCAGISNRHNVASAYLSHSLVGLRFNSDHSVRWPEIDCPQSSDYSHYSSVRCTISAQPETPPKASTRPSAPPSGPPASKPEAEDDAEDIWAGAGDHVEVQGPAVVQAHARAFAKTSGGYKRDARRGQSSTPVLTTTARPTISSGKLKPQFEPVGHRSTPRRGRTPTPTPIPTLPDRSPTRAGRRNRKLAFGKTVKRTPVITVFETEEEPETSLVRRRSPWFGRPVRVHVGFREEVTVRDLPMMKWDVMARRKFRGEIPLRPDNRPRIVNKKYKGPKELEFELVPMYELEGEQEPDFDPDLVPEKEPETGSEEESGPEQAPFTALASAMVILSQNGAFSDEIKSRGDCEPEPEPEPQGHWAEPALQGHSAAPAKAQQSAGLRRSFANSHRSEPLNGCSIIKDQPRQEDDVEWSLLGAERALLCDALFTFFNLFYFPIMYVDFDLFLCSLYFLWLPPPA